MVGHFLDNRTQLEVQHLSIKSEENYCENSSDVEVGGGVYAAEDDDGEEVKESAIEFSRSFSRSSMEGNCFFIHLYYLKQ